MLEDLVTVSDLVCGLEELVGVLDQVHELEG